MQYLYIAEEVETVWHRATQDEPSSFKYVARNQYAKIGITSQSPWERLRKLQVGNPRILQFTHMWVGVYHQIEWIERYIKDGSRTEWFAMSSKQMCRDVEEHIQKQNYTEIYKLNDSYTPYRATAKGSCTFWKYGDRFKRIPLHANDIFEELKSSKECVLD